MGGIKLQGSAFSEMDIRGAAEIHRKEIHAGFLSSLGGGILELVFSSAAESEPGVLILAKEVETGSVCGFVCGSTDTGALYRHFLRRHTLTAFVHVIPQLMTFERLRKAVETLLYPVKSAASGLPSAELLDIAVRESHRGSGLAQMLFHAFGDALRCKGVNRFRVGTGQNLTRAQRFYEKLGARKFGSMEVHKGEGSVFYVYDIPSDRPGCASESASASGRSDAQTNV